MKFYENKSVVQKIVISLILVISFNFAVPVKVNADVGGVLLSPLFALVTVIVDVGQHVLEWAMLGETSFFMKDTPVEANGKTTAKIHIEDLTSDDKELKFDGELWAFGSYKYPSIRYTPEEIFSNRVPMLDINFINPSVKTGDDKVDEERNVAMVLQPTISSWYGAIRTLALVGLLSVLVYLGIRILLTSIAADRAKYKNILKDWLVAMCLVIALHYIMSFALTMAETVTAMISSGLGQSVTVYVPDGNQFNTNLMGFVRFMIQCTDLQQKITFLGLYIMLVIYSWRFTWVYLKRVANMAFLTLIAPVVTLTYPIDKVSDGKAQAFNMWIKEFAFNALLQPLHLLIYTVLLGSALQVAVNNPLYAIVCLGFIIAAEKLLKKMFGFDKASGGTLGSLAGAAGITAMAGKALNALGGGKSGGSGKGSGKLRTKEIPERQGKDNNVNLPFRGFKNRTSDNMIGASASDDIPLPPEYTQSEVRQNNPEGLTKEQLQRRDELIADGFDENDPEWKQALGSGVRMPQTQETTNDDSANGYSTGNSSNIETPNFVSYESQEKGIRTTNNQVENTIGTGKGGKGLKQKPKRTIKGNVAKGALKALPQIGYKGVRGGLKLASRAALGATMAGLGLAIGATTGDGEKALSMAAAAGGIGLATGDNLFEATAGKVMRDNKTVGDAFGAGKYGNVIDARNAKADKEYFKNGNFDNFYEKNYKGRQDFKNEKYTKKQIRDITQSYRSAGITSEKDIRRAVRLEEKYRKENPNLSEKDCREQVQNIVQSFGDMNINQRAFSGHKETKDAEINRIAGMLDGGVTANNKQTAKQIFKGYSDWRDI